MVGLGVVVLCLGALQCTYQFVVWGQHTSTIGDDLLVSIDWLAQFQYLPSTGAALILVAIAAGIGTARFLTFAVFVPQMNGVARYWSRSHWQRANFMWCAVVEFVWFLTTNVTTLGMMLILSATAAGGDVSGVEDASVIAQANVDFWFIIFAMDITLFSLNQLGRIPVWAKRLIGWCTAKTQHELNIAWVQPADTPYWCVAIGRGDSSSAALLSTSPSLLCLPLPPPLPHRAHPLPPLSLLAAQAVQERRESRAHRWRPRCVGARRLRRRNVRAVRYFLDDPSRPDAVRCETDYVSLFSRPRGFEILHARQSCDNRLIASLRHRGVETRPVDDYLHHAALHLARLSHVAHDERRRLRLAREKSVAPADEPTVQPRAFTVDPHRKRRGRSQLGEGVAPAPGRI